VIDGHKWFTTAADGAAFAIVMAVTNPDAPPHCARAMIIVPTDTPGFACVRNIPSWATRAGLGQPRRDPYEGCRVPARTCSASEGAGFLIAQERLGPGRIHHCMRWIGICERAFEMMCRARRRRSSPASRSHAPDHPGWIAESRAEINAARLMVLTRPGDRPRAPSRARSRSRSSSSTSPT
jgi:acyl-CoA dehydrogenase